MSGGTGGPRIDADLVRRLVAEQFPQWADLAVERVRPGGWNNVAFHLGPELVVRLPRAAAYVPQAEKEQAWLPRLAAGLPLAIPAPLGLGRPGEGYPWAWSICGWIVGETAAAAPPADHVAFARDLAAFLVALRALDAAEGPPPGPHNFQRGDTPAVYDAQTMEALAVLQDRLDVDACRVVWAEALDSGWDRAPVWLHGDVAPGNLILRQGRLAAVIDWGICGVGDPACDLAIAWTFLSGEARAAFRDRVGLDAATWARARGWALWKALILAAGFSGDHPDAADSWRVIDEVLADPIVQA